MAWFSLPDGNQLDTVLVRAVMLYPGKGVALKDAQQRLVAFVKVEDTCKGELARDAIMLRVKKQKTDDIDWTFLSLDEPVADQKQKVDSSNAAQ